MEPLRYSIIIEWSDEDNEYIVLFPDFPRGCTYGETYEDALKNGKEVLEMLVEKYQALGQSLPQPRSHHIAA
jgi:predicted RNase H-like HicB family nuclease